MQNYKYKIQYDVSYLNENEKGLKHPEDFKTDRGTKKHKGHQLHGESTTAHRQLVVVKCRKSETAGNQARKN